MEITLTGGELELAIEEYLIARGLREGGTYDIRVIGGRNIGGKQNKSTALINVTFDRIKPLEQISTVYTEPETVESENDPYEEEPEEEIVPTKSNSPFASFSKIEEPVDEEEEEEEETEPVSPPVTNLFK